MYFKVLVMFQWRLNDFFDEKVFTVDLAINQQNDRIDQDAWIELRCVSTTKHPTSAIILGLVASNSEKMASAWFDGGYRLTALTIGTSWQGMSSRGWERSPRREVTFFSRTVPRLCKCLRSNLKSRNVTDDRRRWLLNPPPQHQQTRHLWIVHGPPRPRLLVQPSVIPAQGGCFHEMWLL